MNSRMLMTPPAASPRTDMEAETLLHARALVDRMRTLYRELERVTAAPISMHRALAIISARPGISPAALATALGMGRPAVSHLLKAMVERGWIERRRQASDQRSVQLTVRPAGRKAVDATTGRAAGTLQRAVRKLSDAELASLRRGLRALLPHVPEPSPGVGPG